MSPIVVIAGGRATGDRVLLAFIISLRQLSEQERMMKRTMGITGILGALLVGALALVGLGFGLGPSGVAGASDGDHTLTVNGQNYQSYKHSGDAIHWETPTPTVESASFPERQQVWSDNGSEQLPCEGGIHWISNLNVLTVSHCLEAPTTTSTTTTTTTTTTLPETTTTLPETTTTLSETTTTLSETTTTAGDTTTTVAAVFPPTSAAPTSTVASGGPVPPAAAPPAQNLPSTGSSSWALVFLALAALGSGVGLVHASRRQ
jgi:LPXTG-motif cell wall-anchored protein